MALVNIWTLVECLWLLNRVKVNLVFLELFAGSLVLTSSTKITLVAVAESLCAKCSAMVWGCVVFCGIFQCEWEIEQCGGNCFA